MPTGRTKRASSLGRGKNVRAWFLSKNDCATSCVNRKMSADTIISCQVGVTSVQLHVQPWSGMVLYGMIVAMLPYHSPIFCASSY